MHTTSRLSPQTQKVQFGNSFAYRIESDLLKMEIAKNLLSCLLPYDQGFEVLASQFPIYPTDGFLNSCFEWIMRYTYVQHNYLLFAFTLSERNDCKDIPIAINIGRKCTVAINKYTQEMYLTHFRFGDDVYKGTVLDGILVQDNCVYPEYFESTYNPSLSHIDTSIPEQLQEEYNRYLSQYALERDSNTPYTFDQTPQELQPISDDDADQLQPQEVPKEKIVILDIPTMLSNYNTVTEVIDYSKIFKQSRLPSKYIYYIQSVYCLFGDKTVYSQQKLVDSIGYKTLMNVNNMLLHGNHIRDDWLDPFELKNCVDTMYYTRHTQVDLRNPFHNDYLRYHPRSCTPSAIGQSGVGAGGQFVQQRNIIANNRNRGNNNNHSRDKNGTNNNNNTKLSLPIEEYDHFVPRMTGDCREWTSVYKLGDELVECQLDKTEYPYVYSLSSSDERVKPDEIAKICTLEGRRYIRVILNKIHTDRQIPIRMMCRPVVRLDDNDIVGWIPVKYEPMQSNR